MKAKTTNNRDGRPSIQRQNGLVHQNGQKPAQPVPENSWRRNGNVAHLPRDVRHKINTMIQDGFTYRAIIQSLGEHGKGLNTVNLSRWKKGGHMDWLAEQAFIERTRSRQETPGQLVRDFDATEVNHAALQLGSLHIFEALRDLGPGSLNKKLGGDCAAFARLLNALSRASKETMQLQKYRDACAKARAALKELKDPNRKLSDSERRAIVRHVDEILGLNSEDDDYPEAQTTAGTNSPSPANAGQTPAGTSPSPTNPDPTPAGTSPTIPTNP